MRILLAIVFLVVLNLSVKSQTIDKINKADTIVHMYTVPGTDVSIVPPKYFMVLPQKNTLLHPTSSSTIQINEIDGSPYPMLVKNINKEYIEKQGVKFISRKDTITDNGKKATLFLVSFSVEAKDSSHTIINFERYMFFTGTYNKTVWINANYPVIARDVIADVLIKSLLSVKFKD